jgi:hypothetical protein
MPHWLIKSALQRAISWLPARQRWNHLFQRYVTRSLGMTASSLAGRLADCQRHLAAYFERHPAAENFTVFELGTGWFPALPIGMFLSGAGRVWTFDIESLLERGRLELLLRCFCELADDGRLVKCLPNLRPDRIVALRAALAESRKKPPAAVLATLGIEVRLDDARKSGIPAGSVDFFFSHSVWQYVPREVLADMLEESVRIARPGAVQSHNVHPGSQFYCFDRKLSPMHFYAYNDKVWRWLDSAVNPQTRLCLADYRELIKAAGLRLVREESIRRDVKELRGIRLAPPVSGLCGGRPLRLRNLAHSLVGLSAA